MKKSLLYLIIVLAMIVPVFAGNSTDIVRNDSWDDSLYDDNTTVEFSFRNSNNQNFCLLHTVKNIDGFDSDKCITLKEKEGNKYLIKWGLKNLSDLSLIWDYTNGAIVRMYTTSPNWETKRGIKVGDSVSKVMECYAKEKQLFMLKESSDGFYVKADNSVTDESMSMHIIVKDNIVSEIEIICGK